MCWSCYITHSAHKYKNFQNKLSINNRRIPWGLGTIAAVFIVSVLVNTTVNCRILFSVYSKVFHINVAAKTKDKHLNFFPQLKKYVINHTLYLYLVKQHHKYKYIIRCIYMIPNPRGPAACRLSWKVSQFLFSPGPDKYQPTDIRKYFNFIFNENILILKIESWLL